MVAHSLKTYRDPYSCSWVITLAFLTGVQGKEERCLRTLIVITAINQLNPSAPCERAVCSRNQRKTVVRRNLSQGVKRWGKKNNYLAMKKKYVSLY